MKFILTLCLCLLNFACFAATPAPSQHAALRACEQAAPSANPDFCSSFKSVAQCHCAENGLGPDTCNDMNALYQYMLDFFGTLENACAFQVDSSYQTCVDDWNCYRNGGTNSEGGQCNATGKVCP